MRRITSSRTSSKELTRNRQLQRKSRGSQRARQPVDRRLHERRQVDAAQPAHRRRRAGGGPAVRHARPHDPPPGAARRRAGAAHRHRRLRPQAAARSGRGVQEHARGRRPKPTCWCTSSTASAVDPEGEIDAVRTVLGRDRRRPVPELLVFNKLDRSPDDVKQFAAAHPGSVAVSARHRRRHRRVAADRRRSPARPRHGRRTAGAVRPR